MLGTIHRWKGKQKGPALICLHGFLGSGADFEVLADHLDASFDIVAPDLPDYAQSLRPESATWQGLLEDLHGLIQSECKERSCILLGYSKGGRIALQYALKSVENIRGLVLVGATPGIPDKEEAVRRRHQDASLASALLDQPMEAFLENWFKRELLRTQANIPEPYRSRMRERRLRNNPETLALCLKKFGTGSMKPVWNRLPELKIPCLIVSGEWDAKFRTIAAKMAARIPASTTSVISAAGHAPCFEQPRAFAGELQKFLYAGSKE